MKRLMVLLSLLFMSALFAQNGKIVGNVYLKGSKTPIPSASIQVKGTSIGAIANNKGRFFIQDIKAGKYTLVCTFVGFSKVEKKVQVKSNETLTLKFELERKSIEVQGMSVSANRAVERETPISFANIKEDEIKDKYTTQDMPEMLESVSGVFSSTTGMGDAEITMRGFDAQKIQVMVNGIPVNDPESQAVYWSNWTGLSSNTKSVQVQKGAGSSLYGSGAFGGSVNIETMGTEKTSSFSVRNSIGFYHTDGKVADGKGEMIDRTPINYNVLLKYNSGKIWGRNHSFQVTAERKAGESYIIGTDYDGWSFGFETDHKLGDHFLNTSFIVAPQNHNQARVSSEEFLMDRLGREYSATNHKWQENKYVKPQFSVRDKWNIAENQLISMNMFLTSGEGGGRYLNNGIFDVNTGEVSFVELGDQGVDMQSYANHARFAYENYGIVLEGYVPEDNKLYYIDAITGEQENARGRRPDNLVVGDGNHSWRNYSVNKHNQIGFNGYYQIELPDFSDYVEPKIITGGEARLWSAEHYAASENFRFFNPLTGGEQFYDEVQRKYDYSSKVLNLSGFLRTNWKFKHVLEGFNVMLDGQYAKYHQEVDENEIKFFDFVKGDFIDEGFYSTQDLPSEDDENALKFSADDYKKDFDFFSPKFGVNLNITKELNFIANYAIAYKEPRVGDWYDRTDGPNMNQWSERESKFYTLEPEKTNTAELGLTYKTPMIRFDATFYNTKYTDKIESGTVDDENLTLNLGEATHKGIELGSNFKYDNLKADVSYTFAHNRWDKMKDGLTEIFHEPIEKVVHKVVPYSPELMSNGSVSYKFEGLPLDGSLNLGLSYKWWNRYFTSFTNEKRVFEYELDEEGTITDLDIVEENDEEVIVSSKLPAFFEINSSIGYNFIAMNKECSVKLNLNNITNRENYSKGLDTKVYNHEFFEKISDGYTTFYTPAPLFNFFITTEIKF